MTHAHTPLEIAEIEVDPRLGCIGIASCPGRGMRKSAKMKADRNLDADLQQIRDWGAAAVVSLVEPAELGWLQVPHLGQEVERHGMKWLHISIKDGGVPEDEAERIWAEVGPRIRGLLQEGQRVLFHCRAGHGRSGMMAARLLIELGWSAESAISEVRRVRPGAIEGAAQQAAVRGWDKVTTMTKSQETSGGFSLRDMAKIADELGHGDSRFAKALKAGVEGKSPEGRPLAKGQRILIAGLKGPRRDSPQTRSPRRMRLNGSGSK